jgi:tetratricopeptide (TPR) repeat protein
MTGFIGSLLVAFIAYSLEWNWAAAIFFLAALASLMPDKKSKKKAKKKKSNTKSPEIASDKRTKLKAATKLKKTDLSAAISMLREAYDDGEAISLDEFLRLPNYLRMNKQYDEAFQECRKLAHYGFFESEKPGSSWWYRDQAKILRLEARICEEEGKYRDALSTRVLIFYYDIKHAEGISKSTVHEGTDWNQNLQERGLRDLELLLSKHDDWTPNFEKLLDNLGHKNKRQEAVSLVSLWASSWPSEPEELQKALDQLLFETK